MAITFKGFAGRSGTLGADPAVDLSGVGLADDDFMIAVGRAGGALSHDGSWNTSPASLGANQPLFWRRWDTGDPTSFTFTTAGAVNSVVVIGVWSGVHTSSPVDDSDGVIGTGALVIPSVDPAGTGRTLAEIAVKLQNTTFTFAGGGELFDSTFATQNFVGAGAEEQNIPNAATGTRTVTPASGAANGVAYSIVLRPATTQHSKSLTAVMDGTPNMVRKVGHVLPVVVMDGTPTLSRLLTGHRELTAVMDGTPTVSRKVATTLTAVMGGVGSLTREVGKTLTAVAGGVGSIASKTGKTLLAVMDGTPTLARAVSAHRVLEVTANGVTTITSRQNLVRTLLAVMGGEPTMTARSVLARTLTAVMNGIGRGFVEFPWDSIPSDCPPDWSPNDGLKAIAGQVLFHEPPNQGDPVSGATVCLIRDVDGFRVDCVTTDPSGNYTFGRDTNDPYTYHVEVNYENAGVKQQGLSEGGCVPV